MKLYDSHNGGYLQCMWKGKVSYFHRVVWELANGPIPKGMVIDHINGDKHDCRLENLRCVTQRINVHNNHKAKGYRLIKGKYWQAYIKLKGKMTTRLCKTEEQAKAVRRCLELIYLEGKV